MAFPIRYLHVNDDSALQQFIQRYEDNLLMKSDLPIQALQPVQTLLCY